MIRKGDTCTFKNPLKEDKNEGLYNLKAFADDKIKVAKNDDFCL